ncbi:RpiB/LacA/LacB family sugar-phosphate isomerase [Phytohabitans suffuscus]|uniref:Ribose 5-phosphate isomerase B n=1 Tax=Phytohabitans suffuscus TaxID=624315 RepID=A0A6F8YVT6_9ACTN|nr:RpiB/LacA/LacB family sugar-phosphate isomerase [Phytohabitans suffuscus]BCB90285.1 ribose 5-phosphate isomerase B [Phytohabitans suffuscus]
MRIAIAADHNGVAVKAALADWLTGQRHTVDDRGAHGDEVVDYPPLCADVCGRVVAGGADRAIVVGGTGGGEAIACNKIRGIRAGLCHSVFLARISSAHNATNVLVLGAKVVTPGEAVEITRTWLETPFKGERHQLRLDQIAALERGDTIN